MTLEQLIIHSAERHPDRPAVSDERGETTYEELEELTNRVARGLQGLGVKKGDRVAVWMPKSAHTIAAMQAALRLGAAYVPIDPMSPAVRAATIMGNCQVAALVSAGSLARQVRKDSLADVPLLASEDDGDGMSWTDLAGLDASPLPAPGTGDDDLAYILYTSGSTGVPKGVCISHQNAYVFVEWAVREVGARAEDRFSNHAPFHFDLSVFDLYASFAVGGCVSIVPEASAYVPRALVEHVLEEQISVWYSVPSALILMMDRGQLFDEGHLPLRTVIFAGEPFPLKHLRRLRDGLPEARLFNWYGPTETNVCTGYEVNEIEPDRTTPVPIGHAVSGDRVWAVKEDGSEAGVGEEGELLVEGPTVMLGYWGREPHGEKPYGTGDIVRLEPDGEYSYVGRRDHMVKVRGHRVELGEIEAALLAHPDVAEAAVVVQGTGIEARLLAFLASSADEPPALLELKRHCAERVPRYMIVDRAVFRDELPRTRNGKIDRLELQRMATEQEVAG